MKRRILTVTVTAVRMATSTGVASADRGAPGATYPEQPAGHPATACAAVGTNPGTGMGGAFEQNAASGALAILGGLYTDACLGG
jgi:hypothetical protein